MGYFSKKKAVFASRATFLVGQSLFAALLIVVVSAETLASSEEEQEIATAIDTEQTATVQTCSDCPCQTPCRSPNPCYTVPTPCPKFQQGIVWPEGQELQPTPMPEGSEEAMPLDSGSEQTPNLFDNLDAANEPTQRLPSGLGAVAASESPSVHMIGDFFGNGYFLGNFDGFATVPLAGGDRRYKSSDNINPLPQDRVFFNYQHFHNSVSDVQGLDQSVDRFTFGFEKTFLDEMLSLEVRLPFASGLDSTQVDGVAETITSEFGNIAFTVKAFLWERCSLLATAGMSTVVPTASDALVSSETTVSLLENNAVHLQPFFGLNWSNPCSRWFSTAYVAVDIDLNGNSLFSENRPAPGAPLTGPMSFLGDVRDQTLLFFDYQIGYWLYKDYGHIGYLNGIIPVFEVHYSRALENAEQFAVYQNPFGKADLVNLTGGLVFDFRRKATVTIYSAAPLRREEAQVFNRTVSPTFQAEVGVQCAFKY